LTPSGYFLAARSRQLGFVCVGARVLSLALNACLLLAPSLLHAQVLDPARTQAAPPSKNVASADDSMQNAPPDATLDATRSGTEIERARNWATAPSRVFASALVDVGALYLRPRVALGYGKPHFAWFGAEANPTVARELLGAYAGVRIALPVFDLRVGTRYGRSFSHDYLPRQDRIDRETLEGSRAQADVVTFESEVNGRIPLGPGQVQLLGSVSYVTGVPDNKLVLEETLRVVVDPPWVLRARVGYAVPFGDADQVSLAPVVDALWVPERKTWLVRAGMLLRFALSRSLELRAALVPRIVSPDRIGLLDSDFTEIGLRWRWATE
jgi:hypothetical protein